METSGNWESTNLWEQRSKKRRQNLPSSAMGAGEDISQHPYVGAVNFSSGTAWSGGAALSSGKILMIVRSHTSVVAKQSSMQAVAFQHCSICFQILVNKYVTGGTRRHFRVSLPNPESSATPLTEDRRKWATIISPLLRLLSVPLISSAFQSTSTTQS